jgi:hypothetical protein
MQVHTTNRMHFKLLPGFGSLLGEALFFALPFPLCFFSSEDLPADASKMG